MANEPPVRVLAKAAGLLEILADHGELTVLALAEEAGEPRSSVYRLLAGLREAGLVETGSRRGTYRLGLWPLRLSAAVVSRFDERQAALPVMERLHEATEETVFLSVRRGRNAVCIERIEGRWVRSMALTLGGALPLHIGAGPRALLAFEPDAAWEEYAGGGPLDPYTANSPASREALFPLLEDARRRGYATSDEDVVLGMAAIGAPIFDYRGKVRAAVSLSGPKATILGDQADANGQRIVAAAAEISRGLGHESEAPPERIARRARRAA